MQTRDALGSQVESLKHNASKPVFGSGTRNQREKVYQDAESEKTYYGRLSPGPCAYDSKVWWHDHIHERKVSVCIQTCTVRETVRHPRTAQHAARASCNHSHRRIACCSKEL